MNNKKLLSYIGEWHTEGLLSDESAQILKQRYSAGRSGASLAIILAVIGSLLIGAGTILLLAVNWNTLPLAVKGIISFMPLLAGQGLAVFTLKKRQDSVPWREGVSVLYTAGVFGTLALIGQSFHISNDVGVYLLCSGLLSLPIPYLLRSVSTLPVYFGSVIAWGATRLISTENGWYLLLTVLLVLAGSMLILQHRDGNKGAAGIYAKWWISVAVLALVIITGTVLEANIIVLVMAYAIVMYALDNGRSDYRLPYRTLGFFASLFFMVVVSFGFCWNMFEAYDGYSSTVVSIVVAVASGVFAMLVYRKQMQQALFAGAASLITVVLALSDISYSSSDDIYLIATVAVTAIVFAIGICMLVKGTRDGEYLNVNTGLITILVIVGRWFFAEDFGLLARGLVFISMGALLLSINLVMAKKKKRALVAQAPISEEESK